MYVYNVPRFESLALRQFYKSYTSVAMSNRLNSLIASSGRVCRNTLSLDKYSNDKALRDIPELNERGIFIQGPDGGCSRSYSLLEQGELETLIEI